MAGRYGIDPIIREDGSEVHGRRGQSTEMPKIRFRIWDSKGRKRSKKKRTATKGSR